MRPLHLGAIKMEKKIAVFLDRDGTVSEEVGYVNHIKRFKLLPKSAQAIKLLNKKKILGIVVTNQSGVARDYFTEELVNDVHNKMRKILRKNGAHLDAIYYCPHHPTVGPQEYRMDCDCRKPKIGMLKRAETDFNIALEKSYMIGDRMKDVIFGHKVGMKSILVLTGYGLGEYEHQREKWTEQPEYIAKDLLDAVRWIIKDLKHNE